MALSEAAANIRANYLFHASMSGGLTLRLAYLTLYYFIFIAFRWGDRYLRALTWLKRLGFSDTMIDVETPAGARLKLDLHTAFDPLYAILGGGDYSAAEGFRPGPGDVVIDAGANVGIYTTYAAARVGAGGVVVAIEPHPGNFELLSGNVLKSGLENVRLVQAAAGEKPARGELFVHDRCINHSLVRASGKSVPVDIKTIDGLAAELGLARVDFIKIDTEGNVIGILRGAAATILRHRPRIAFELDLLDESSGLDAFLADAGYRTERMGTIAYARPVIRQSS